MSPDSASERTAQKADRAPPKIADASKAGCDSIHTTEAPCPVCASMRNIGEDFIKSLTERGSDLKGVAEAIVDCLGFCEPHGKLLVRNQELIPSILTLQRQVTGNALALFDDDARGNERLFAHAWASERACPVCRFSDHRLVQQLHSALQFDGIDCARARLCFPHYRALVSLAPASTLSPLARHQARLLGDAVERLEASTPQDALPAATAIAVVAGEVPRTFDEHSVERLTVPCAVCSELERTDELWLDAVRIAAPLRHDLWTVAPMCGMHLQKCVSEVSWDLSRLVMLHTAQIQSSSLVQGLIDMAADEHKRQVASGSVFYRRRSPAYVLGQQRKLITQVPPCPACERLAITQDREISQLLEVVGPRHRSAAATSLPPVCMKHFARAYLLLPTGAPKALLIEHQRRRMRELRTRIAGAQESQDSRTSASALRAFLQMWATRIAPVSSASR